MTRIVAHRGFSAAYPENTMLAFEKAVAAGCDMLELDVQLSKDGRIVIIHDETLLRTTGRQGRVRELEFAELRRLDASAAFAGRYGPNPIPSLEEYLDFAAALSIPTIIELKNYVYPYPGLEEKLIAAVRGRGLQDRVIYASFNHQSLLECRRLCPECEIAFISGGWLVEAGDYCASHGADYLSVRSSFLTVPNLKEVEDRRLRVMAWTVDDPAEMAELAERGVHALITDEPALARTVLGAPPKHRS